MNDYHLTPDHYHSFGYITSTYAKVEQGFKIIISGILGAEMHVVAVLCEPYSTYQLRNVITSLSDLHTLPNDGNQRLHDLVGELKSFSKLRNSIAHFMWTHGTRKNSVKPIHIDIRSGKPKTKGVDDAEQDWTIEELDAEAIRLQSLDRSLIQLIGDLGFTPTIDT